MNKAGYKNGLRKKCLRIHYRLFSMISTVKTKHRIKIVEKTASSYSKISEAFATEGSIMGDCFYNSLYFPNSLYWTFDNHGGKVEKQNYSNKNWNLLYHNESNNGV